MAKDPNRYAENRHIRPDGPWQLMQALFSLSLMLCGLLGLAIHLFGGQTQPLQWLDWLTQSPLHLIILAGGLLGLVLFHHYITRISDHKHRIAGNLPMYAMMLLGAYFVFRLITTGHW